MNGGTLTPAYGKDYNSKKIILTEWNDGRDFILNNMSSQWDGKAINRTDAESAKLTSFQVRYQKQRKVTVITFKNGVWV